MTADEGLRVEFEAAKAAWAAERTSLLGAHRDALVKEGRLRETVAGMHAERLTGLKVALAVVRTCERGMRVNPSMASAALKIKSALLTRAVAEERAAGLGSDRVGMGSGALAEGGVR